MAEQPIIFSAPMIRALLDGRKTQTRRVIKDAIGDLDRPMMMDDGSWHVVSSRGTDMSPIRVPWRVGDRLWVRENIYGDENPWGGQQGVRYVADNDLNCELGFHKGFFKLRLYAGGEGRIVPSIHMPRWASRLTLDVADVRVERLQDISEADAIAEGLKPAPGGWWSGAEGQSGTTPRVAYALLWHSLHGPDAWSANPWVTATTFEVARANIDSLLSRAAA